MKFENLDIIGYSDTVCDYDFMIIINLTSEYLYLKKKNHKHFTFTATQKKTAVLSSRFCKESIDSQKSKYDRNNE